MIKKVKARWIDRPKQTNGQSGVSSGVHATKKMVKIIHVAFCEALDAGLRGNEFDLCAHVLVRKGSSNEIAN